MDRKDKEVYIMLDRRKLLAILALNRMIEQGDIYAAVNQIFIRYWISYEIMEGMKDMDVIVEAERIMIDSLN